jgi:hypothetical protein
VLLFLTFLPLIKTLAGFLKSKSGSKIIKIYFIEVIQSIAYNGSCFDAANHLLQVSPFIHVEYDYRHVVFAAHGKGC